MFDPPERSIFESNFQGIHMLQWWTDLPLIQDIVWENNIRNILEIGTASGGLSLFLSGLVVNLMHERKKEYRFMTVDIHESNLWEYPQAKFYKQYISVVVEDCFKSQEVENFIRDSKSYPLLVLCDGGNKPKEFKTFASKLKPGDIIGVHDYHYEFQDSDFESVSMPEGLHLIPFLPSRWDKSYWFWSKVALDR